MSIQTKKKKAKKIEKIAIQRQYSVETKVVLTQIESSEDIISQIVQLAEPLVKLLKVDELEMRREMLYGTIKYYDKQIEDYMHIMQLGKGILSGPTNMRINAKLIYTRIKRSKAKSEWNTLSTLVAEKNKIYEAAMLLNKIIAIRKGWDTQKYSTRALSRSDVLALLTDRDKDKMSLLQDKGLAFELPDEDQPPKVESLNDFKSVKEEAV